MPPKAEAKPKGGKSKQTQQKKSAAKRIGGSGKAKKKWSKSTTKESKTTANVLLDAPTYEKLQSSVPTMKNITVSSVADRLQCNLSVARRGIRLLKEKGLIRPVIEHSTFLLYTRLAAKPGQEGVPEKPVREPKDKGPKDAAKDKPQTAKSDAKEKPATAKSDAKEKPAKGAKGKKGKSE
ncbi:MAG: hypothetical protein EZS28_034377 [Streblomastix strix]|uniref:40S ribosomal protein S25 n=1 Tax=Streblomastix strix TaxID=222440 RepID=A0A5J4UK75_9EUKA|nr:MAG: hypothetical protein EZS28_034377 [Streblomastix strix]